MKEHERINQDEPAKRAERHRRTLIIITAVLVLLPLVLGAFRLAGYL